METGFKVGDRVRVISTDWPLYLGAVGYVETYEVDGDEVFGYWIDVGRDNLFFLTDELEPVTEDSDVQGRG